MSAATARQIAAQLAALWEEMAPAVSYQYDAQGIERWDGKGEGPCRCLAFEGFGMSFSLFFGRMPREGTH
ncbi:hypothetical protein U1872_18150 [Sphingomonas sp. RB3P16]|uniref:hypothetical protein n=1 Tax=Parasphingomonas frigoris TaxID=3096163 RepID=UPI002FC77425